MALTIPNTISNGIAADGANLGANFDAISAWATTVEADIAGTSPTGSVIMFAGTVLPSGYLRCRGDDVSRSTYADLFAALGTAFGSGDGSTTFGLPDFRAAFPAGMDPSSSPFNSLGATGGARDAVLPSHTHTLGTHSHTFSDTTSSDSHTHTTNIDHDHPSVTTSTDSHDHRTTDQTGRYYAGDDNGSAWARGGGSSFSNQDLGSVYTASDSHNHTVNLPSLGTTNITSSSDSHTHTVSGTTSSNSSGATASEGVSATDGNIPPFVALDFIIKT